jgi:hypothetical protein
MDSFVDFPEKDWEDIKFGVENKVDFYALSFVKDAEVVHELKAFLKGMSMEVFCYDVFTFFLVCKWNDSTTRNSLGYF